LFRKGNVLGTIVPNKIEKNEKYFSATHEEENEDCMPNERLLHFFRK
jgi:hypothetical protein